MYIKMSEEDAALYWEMDPDPASSLWSENVGPALPPETAESIVAEKVTSTVSVPARKPDESNHVIAYAALSDVIQDTKT